MLQRSLIYRYTIMPIICLEASVLQISVIYQNELALNDLKSMMLVAQNPGNDTR